MKVIIDTTSVYSAVSEEISANVATEVRVPVVVRLKSEDFAPVDVGLKVTLTTLDAPEAIGQFAPKARPI